MAKTLATDTSLLFLVPSEVSEVLGESTAELGKWRAEGTGPKFVKLSSRSILYWRVSVLEWLKELEGAA